MDKFSDNYKDLSKEVNSILTQQLSVYQHLFYEGDYKLVQMPDGNAGICTDIRVPVGSDSELLEYEPVVISIEGDNIETATISVYPDRIDFPFDSFPHINYAVGDMQSSICLTREDFCEWYAEHTFGELIQLIGDWYKDAAEGNLMKTKQGDFFEPFRLQSVDGILFKMPLEDTFIEQKESAGYIVHPLEILDKDKRIYQTNLLEIKPESQAYILILWRPCSQICFHWFNKHLKKFGELCSFAANNGFELNGSDLIAYFKEEKNPPKHIIFQFAFVRPVTVIGKTNKLDYLSYAMSVSDYLEQGLNANVYEISVIDENTSHSMRFLSKTSPNIADKKILILGCGAIGSKLIFHLYRSGITNLTFCDKDNMLPHNICRHALSRHNYFLKKVNLLRNELLHMYLSGTELAAIDTDILQWLPQQDLSVYDLIIDTTASACVMRLVDDLSKQYPSVPFIHYALSDAGNIGLVYTNINRNLQLSDYYMYLLHLAINDEGLQKWITKEMKYNHDRVRIGEGCHSNTMVLSDDMVTIHTSAASNYIRAMFDNKKNTNNVFMSIVNLHYNGEIATNRFNLPAFVSIKPENNSDWRVRLPDSLLSKIRIEAKIANTKEIGGYLMGMVDVKHKIVYILWSYTPQKSKQSCNRLLLSDKGWKEERKRVSANTANSLMYVGDWHSHPKGSLVMSDIDVETSKKIYVCEIATPFGVTIITNASRTSAYLLPLE